MSRGLFLSLDGLDGTGKSTQCRLLVEWLRAQGHRVTACADPGGTALGDVLRGLLLDHRRQMSLACEAFMFMASRAQLVAEVIRPALAQRHIVVADRFVLANVVYQGHAGGLDPALLWQMVALSTGGLEPDLTLVLDLPVAEALARRGRPADRLEQRDRAFHERVRAGFCAEVQRRPDRCRLIDAAPPTDIVQQQIRQEISRVVAACQGS
jgi:dTMP kinase